MTALTKQAETSSRRAISSILIGCATMFVILELGVTWLAALLDQTWAALIVTAVMVLVAVLFERQAFKKDAAQGLRAVGYGRPNLRAVLVAAIIGLIMLAFFPIFSTVTGAQITLKAEPQYLTAVAIWLLLQIGMVFLVYLFLNNLLKPQAEE